MMSILHSNRLHIEIMEMCKRPHLISIIIRHQEIASDLADNLKKCLMIYF